MSSILYYSNYCDNCKTLLQTISKWSGIKEDMHFINIDKRVKKNGATYVVLENGQEILLPPTITKVPALLLLNKGHHVLFGSDINKHLEPKQAIQANVAMQNNGEPMAFAIYSAGGYGGVSSDNYSFLDQDATSLSAKGDGGMRQQHHYATLDYDSNIDTPPDTYSPDTIGSVSMEQLQQKRNNDVLQKR